MTDRNEHESIWAGRSATWECDECGAHLRSPAEFEIVDGRNVCNDCREDSRQ